MLQSTRSQRAGYDWKIEQQQHLRHVGSSFLTRDQTWAPALGSQSLSHWTTKEVPEGFSLNNEVALEGY